MRGPRIVVEPFPDGLDLAIALSGLGKDACDLVYLDRVGEIYELHANPNHRWYYFTDMKRDEVILIKGFDSDRTSKARFAPHSAVNHPDGKPSDPERVSIEVRAVASF